MKDIFQGAQENKGDSKKKEQKHCLEGGQAEGADIYPVRLLGVRQTENGRIREHTEASSDIRP